MTVSPADRKRQRYAAHHWLSEHSIRAGAHTCMHALDGAGAVNLTRTAGGVVTVAGVQRCGSVWACPVCAPVVRERRGSEVDQAVSRALDMGWQVAFVTATVSHQLGDHLRDVYNLVTESWRTLFGARAAGTLKAKGYRGQIRVIEVTHGINGWHPHIHAVLFFQGARSDLDRLLLGMGQAFSSAVASRGGVALVPAAVPESLLDRAPGWDWTWCEKAGAVSQYMAKIEGGWGVGPELSRGDLKLSRKGTTPWQLLQAAVAGDPDAAVLFRIYEQCTRGRKFMVWSRGFKALFGIEDIDDETAAIAEVDEAPEVTWSIPVEYWQKTVKAGHLGALLERASRCPAWVDLLTGEILSVST